MKKLLLLLAVLLMTATSIMAQNANRKGFFIELQGGAAFGEVLKYESIYELNDLQPSNMSKLKGGMVGNVDFGYRWATSLHFSFEAKLGAWANLADLGRTLYFRIMPGVRWTSNDFGSNMSTFIAFNAGAGGAIKKGSVIVPLELAFGLNFTQRFYGGIVFNYSLNIGRKYVDKIGYKYNGKWERIDIRLNNYPSFGLRLGYRF